jgi:hypothetical protein
MKNCLRMFPLVCTLLATSVIAQPPSAPAASPDGEATGVVTAPAATGPIVVNWHFKNNGLANLTVNSDGSYLFSGHFDKKESGKDFDIALALKSSTGGVILFHYVGDADNGVQWSEQGQETILKDDFQTFAGKHDYYGEYSLPLSSEGRAKLFEERKRKEEELKKAEEEARKRHDEKVAAEKKKEREEEEQKQREEAQQAAEHRSSGGSSVWSTVGSVAATIGGVLAAIF